MKQLIFLSCAVFLSIKSYGQNQVGLIPQINPDFKLGNSWKVNAKVEGRQIFIQNPFPAGNKEREFERLDLEFIATTDLDPLHAVGGGYLIRRSGKSFTHRFIQQYSITRNLSGSRMSHRFRTDQTFEKVAPIQLRVRYRVSWEKPLDGLELDPGEFYIKLNNEYLGILQEAKGDVEIRGLASLGFDISDKNQIETGIDYRAETLVGSPTHKLFLNIALYHSF
jgi:hypothetical protein